MLKTTRIMMVTQMSYLLTDLYWKDKRKRLTRG
jgi:hypothetical protein